MKEMDWQGGKIMAATDDSSYFLVLENKKVYL
jgi:hypothetical protein